MFQTFAAVMTDANLLWFLAKKPGFWTQSIIEALTQTFPHCVYFLCPHFRIKKKSLYSFFLNECLKDHLFLFSSAPLYPHLFSPMTSEMKPCNYETLHSPLNHKFPGHLKGISHQIQRLYLFCDLPVFVRKCKIAISSWIKDQNFLINKTLWTAFRAFFSLNITLVAKNAFKMVDLRAVMAQEVAPSATVCDLSVEQNACLFHSIWHRGKNRKYIEGSKSLKASYGIRKSNLNLEIIINMGTNLC